MMRAMAFSTFSIHSTGNFTRRSIMQQSSIVALTCLTIAAAAPGHHGHHAMARGGHTRLAPAPAAPTKNIAELAIATPQLSTLLAAVKAAGLVDTLASEGPFTVFAPTNEAFAKVPKAALKAQDVPVGSTDVKTAGGEEITVTRDNYIKVKSSAGGAGVVAFDVLATNGVVHLVDTVF